MQFIVYMKKLIFSCGPARCAKLVTWPTDNKCCTALAYGVPRAITIWL